MCESVPSRHLTGARPDGDLESVFSGQYEGQGACGSWAFRQGVLPGRRTGVALPDPYTSAREKLTRRFRPAGAGALARFPGVTPVFPGTGQTMLPQTMLPEDSVSLWRWTPSSRYSIAGTNLPDPLKKRGMAHGKTRQHTTQT